MSVARGGRGRAVFWGGIVVLVVATGWVTRFGTHWPALYYMTGPSMEPTVAAEEYFVAWSPPGDLDRGSLVLFRFVDDDGEFHVLRRIAGLPGDTVSMRDGRVVVNHQVQSWPYRVLEPAAWRSELALDGNLFTWGPRVVPEDSVLLLADTRDMLGWPDSRFIGWVGRQEIIARATRTVWGRRLE